MKMLKEYASIEDYIEHANIANQNAPEQSDDIFEEAISVLEHMKAISGSPNIVDIKAGKQPEISTAEYDELIEWLESLDETKH